MGVGPDILDEAVESERLMIAYAAEHSLKNVWVRIKRSGRPDGFIRAGETSGENVAELPEGEHESWTLDSRGADRMRKDFATFLTRYLSSEFGPVDADLAESFDMTLKACAPNFRETTTRQIADGLFRDGGFGARIAEKPVVLDTRVVASGVNSQLHQLRAMYVRHGADAWLLGGLETARDVCEAGARLRSGDPDQWSWEVAQYFSVGWAEPYELARRVVSKTGGAGLDPVTAIGETRRDEVDDAIESARDAPDVDSMLDRIYAAIPAVNECYDLYTVLMTAPDSIANDQQRGVWRQVYKVVFEKRSRMLESLINSVLDLGGLRWNRCRREIAQANQVGGPAAAEAQASRFVNELMLYPRALLPALLSIDRDPRSWSHA